MAGSPRGADCVIAVRGWLGSYLTEAGRRALGNLLGLAVWTALWQLSGVGALLLLTRALGPEQFGALSFALTAQTYLVLLGSLSCGSVVIREGVQRPSDMDAIGTSFLVLTGTSSALVCAGSLIAVALAPMSNGERWLLILVALGSVPAAMNAQPLFDAHHRQASGAAVGALAEVLGLLAVVWLWRGGGLSLPAVGAVYAAKWGLTLAGQILAYHAGVRRLRWRWRPEDMRRILRSSWPILFAALLFFVPLTSGVLVLRLRSGPADAALFGLASQVASAYLIFAGLGLQVVQPHIAGRYGLHPGFLAKLALFSAALLGGLGALALAGGWGVVRLLLPPFYQAAVRPMAWLLVAALLLAVARLTHVYLLRLEDASFILAAHLASALLYVGGCLLSPATWIGPAAAVLAPGAVLIATAACLWRVRVRIREGASA